MAIQHTQNDCRHVTTGVFPQMPVVSINITTGLLTDYPNLARMTHSILPIAQEVLPGVSMEGDSEHNTHTHTAHNAPPVD